MNDLFSVEGKNVLITGGSGGIGSELVNGFIKAGAHVVSFDKVPSTTNCEQHVLIDLSNKQDIEQVFAEYIELHDRIDVLINCAAVTIPNVSVMYPLESWDSTMNVTLNSVFYMCRLTGLQMRKQGTGGPIINFTSINAAQAMPHNPAYAAAKAGVRHLTKSFAYDFGKYNIRVNNIGPGYTKTKMNTKSLSDPAAYQLRADNSMLGRWANPIEMVGPAIFLASDASSFVTGTDLWVDGGWLSKGM